MSAALVTMLGEELATQGGTVQTSEALAGKTVALYFSAHWCPPCRGFTPKFAEAYTSNLSAKGLEVVFVSSDKDQASFDDYFGSMPWKALPFSARDTKAALSKKFKVQGIPSCVILDADGKTITTDGVQAVSSDPTGDDFPWKPPTVAEALGESFLGQDGAALDKSAVEGKVLGIYFSAHWCPPCRGFTPVLAEWYKKVKPSLPDFEIVFASSDRSQDDFAEYFAEMPWIALPFAERKKKEQLSSMFGVNGIPAFVIVDKDGSTITTNGRGIPSSDPEGKNFPWVPSPLRDLTDPDGLNDTPCLVVMMEAANEATQESIRAALLPIAEEYAASAKETGDDEMLIFAGGPSAKEIITQIRQVAKTPLKDDAVDVVLLDFADAGGYYKGEGVEHTTAGFQDFIAKYKSKSLKRCQAGEE